MAIFFLLGNTNVKLSRRRGELLTFPIASAAEDLPGLLQSHRGEVAVAACVNPLCEPVLAAVTRGVGLAGPVYAGRDFPTGVELAVERPEAVGMDRILNVKAAYARAAAACAVADLGTAVSVSVADAEGRFVGGSIFPGIAMALRALAEGTALLPEVEPARVETPLGRNTMAAMQGGVYFGTIGALREVIERIEIALGEDVGVEGLKTFLTGGDAEMLEHDALPEWEIAPDLTIEGLRLAYEQSA